MKKVCFLIVVVVVTSLVSCTAQKSPKPILKDNVDSLAYAMGLAQSEGLKDYLARGMNIDSIYLSDFFDGLIKSAGVSEDDKRIKKDIAYSGGIQIGQQVSRIATGINSELFGNDSTRKINKDNFVAGLIHGTSGKGALMSTVEAEAYARTTSELIKAQAIEAQYAENKTAGEKFLEENKTKEGVQITASGLQYKVLTQGKGAVPTTESSVKVHYRGTLIDGTEFDSSLKRSEPASFRADQVIKGWTEALSIMPVGSKWELYIPQELAYGSKDSGQIKPFSALIFEVELLGIEK
ncbi:FKBP-type 22 kDa peptidyl-prolyl cis-trans isomerase [termite gut metagenome]|uniref:peptidylprolyl isomerase n=1 Tax=termite gut metagenome TaxID=433724 RepID=A0A5J4RI13_9ZZZZ